MLRSRHSKRNEHTGENKPTKRKKKGAYTCNLFLAFKTRGKQLHFLKRLTKMVVKKPKIKKKRNDKNEIH